MQKTALLVGNTDGIGLATTKRLLTAGWNVIGISKSESSLQHPSYSHRIGDVVDDDFSDLLDDILSPGAIDLCGYFAGIGELLNPLDMQNEPKIFDVNLTGMIKTAAKVVPCMVRNGQGHFLGISSLADELVSAEAPSYTASKAGFSNYLRGLSLALKPKGIYVTNVRFGFVDTKMAKGDFKPFLMSVEKAVDHLEYCFHKKPRRHTAPKIMIPLVKVQKLATLISG